MAINVLGLSFGHDGGACVVKDGKLLSAIATALHMSLNENK